MSTRTRSSLLDEIEGFLRQTGMGETYFGRKAVNNTEVVKRLRQGRDVTTATAETLRKFIRDNRPSQKTEAAG